MKKEKYQALNNFWAQCGKDGCNESELQEALNVFRYNRHAYEQKRKRKGIIIRCMKYAAALLFPMIASYLVWDYTARSYSENDELLECYVPEGKVDSLLLSDGTKVKVNAGTTILYPKRFNKRNHLRNVYVNGEAHFIVSKDREHPFVVHAGNLKVKVLGTHFGVKSYDNEPQISVTLEEGLVSVSDKKEEVILHPNQQMNYERQSGIMTVKAVDATAYNSWTSGDLNFSQQTLEEILRSLKRQYNVQFIVKSNVDLKQKFTMNFKKEETIGNVMQVLTVVSGNLHYLQNGDKITLFVK